MITILMATLNEAQPLLDLLHAKKRLEASGTNDESRDAEHKVVSDAKPGSTPSATRIFETYSFEPQGIRPGGLVIITGIGPILAAAATEYAIRDRGARHILNVGICGGLTHTVEPGHMCHVTEILEGDALLKNPEAKAQSLATESLWASLPPARLVTVSEPVFGGPPRDILVAHADLVDMEGYAVVKVCQSHQVPCQLLKVVSDRADDSGHKELHLNMTRVSTLMAEEVVAGLEHHLGHKANTGSLLTRLFNFVKIEHTIFSLPLILAGAWLGAGGQWPGTLPLMLVMVAGLGARDLGMAMNRILDRHIDQLNPRTATRELPTGRLNLQQAWIVVVAGLLVYLAACAALGPLCLKLSPIPALVLISYSLLKRFSNLCHFGIGVCLALGPLGGYVAIAGSTDIPATVQLLALFTFCWISGFDIIYALQDMKSDRETGVHSLPAALGSKGAQWVAASTHLVAILASGVLWHLLGRGWASGAALAVTVLAFGLAYNPKIPLPARFFPLSAIAGIAGAMVAML